MFRLAQKENLIIPAHIDYLASLRDFITQIGKKYHFSHKFVNTFKLAVDEAATNIIKHAYSESEGYITIQAVVKRNSLTLKILDQGAYFDPKWAQEPNLKESLNSDEKMGLGIFMMRKLMDQVDYKKSTSGNELTLTKKDQFKKGRLRLFNFSDLPTALKIRYLIHALIFVTVLNGSGYYYFYKIASTEVKANFIHVGEKISKQVTQQLSAITPEILNGPDGLSYLKAIILPIHDENLGRIYSLSLEDSLGFIAWSTIPTELNSSFQRPELNTKYEENIFNYSIGRENEVYEFESELIFETGKTFYKKLHVLISNNYLVHEIRKKRITYLKYALLSLGLCFIIIAFISYFVSHPIHKLTKWVRAAKTGNLLDEMDIDASTEIGEIAQAFSDITEKFNQSQKHLAVREQYEKEINLAKDIQRSLLPREIPEIETLEISTYYEPAKTVGGDFYDFIEVDQEHIGIAIADVSGKGVPGSLMMTIIRTALRTEARGSNDAAEVLIRVNDFVANDMQSGMFATIFYIIINTKTLVANFASAGHNPLMLHSRSKKCTFNLNPNGFPVGIKLPIKDYFAQNIKSETIQLAQDELVLLYTDGITEAMNPAKQLYGEERLVNIISKSANLTVKKFTEKLKNSIYSFTEDGALHDDITFIALKPKKKTTDDIDYDSSLSVEVNFLSIADSNKIIDIILNDPNWGAEEICQALNTKQYGKLELEPERILSELSRRQLHTVALRLKYVESKKKTRFSTAKPNNADIISILEEPPKKPKKQKNADPGEDSIPVSSHSTDKLDKPDYSEPITDEEDSGTILKDIIEVLQPHTSSTLEDTEAEATPTETSELTTPPEVTLDANSIEPEQVKELTESAELSAISEKKSDLKEAEAEEPATTDETTETEAKESSETLETSDPTVAEVEEIEGELETEASDLVESPPSAEIPKTAEGTKSKHIKESSKTEEEQEVHEVEETTKTESVSEPEKATEAETTVAEIVDLPETIEDPENTELPDKQVESAEPTEIENDDAIEFDISDNVDISDLLVDSIFEKFLNEALGEHTLQPNLEETSDAEEEETPSAEIKESEAAIAVEVKPENPDSDIKKTSEKELATGDEAPEAEQPEAVRPAPELPEDKTELRTPESENETKAAKGSKKIKGTKPASKQKKVKPKRKKKTKATQVKLKPFVAPTEKNQNPLEYEFVLGNATELIGFEINEEREFEDFYDLSSDLDVEFERELELEEYELVLDIRPDDDDDFEEKAAKDEIEATALLSEEPNIEEIDTTESIESFTAEKVETTTLTLKVDDVAAVETDKTDEIKKETFQTEEIDDAAVDSSEQAESLAKSDVQPDSTTRPASTEAEDFGLELFADLNVFDDDAFAQDLAEFDQPTLEEKTSKEPRVQKPVPFSGLQTNELEDIYRVKPRKSRRKKAATSATEATEISAQQEPKTEALRVKTKIIEEPISEPVEISSAQPAATESETQPPDTEKSNEEQEDDVQYLENISGSHSEEPPIEGSESSSPRDEQASPEVAATPNVEEDTILQDNLTESEGAAILQEDEEASVISKEMPLQQPGKQFSDTPFISLKTNEIEDKYAKDIGLKQSKVIKYGMADSQSRQQEAPIESKLQATETIEVEIKTATAELTQETKPEIAHEPEAEEPTAEPVAKTPEPEVIEPEPAQVISPNLTQAEDDKDELKEHLLTGVTYYKNKEYEDAIIFLKKVIKLDPNMKEAFAMLGNAYYRNGMLYEAIMAYEQLEPHNLKDPSIYENLGLIYWKLNQNKKAVSAWQSLLSLTPERADIKKRIDYLEQNGTQELKAQIRKISHKQNGKTKNNISDNGKQSILKKALDQYRSQDYKSAIDSLKLALEHFPENTEIYTYLANCYFRNKMFDDAVKIYERLKRLDKNNTTVLENLGMLHLKQGAFKQAVAEWQKVVNKQPGRADLKQKIAKVSELIENN